MKSTDRKKKKKMMKPQQIHLKKIEKARQKTRVATETDIPILSQKLQFLLKLCVGYIYRDIEAILLIRRPSASHSDEKNRRKNKKEIEEFNDFQYQR